MRQQTGPSLSCVSHYAFAEHSRSLILFSSRIFIFIFLFLPCGNSAWLTRLQTSLLIFFLLLCTIKNERELLYIKTHRYGSQRRERGGGGGEEKHTQLKWKNTSQTESHTSRGWEAGGGGRGGQRKWKEGVRPTLSHILGLGRGQRIRKEKEKRNRKEGIYPTLSHFAIGAAANYHFISENPLTFAGHLFAGYLCIK